MPQPPRSCGGGAPVSSFERLTDDREGARHDHGRAHGHQRPSTDQCLCGWRHRRQRRSDAKDRQSDEESGDA
ncbi:hypothetical protein J4732_08010 [Serratia marcescens]|uniref:Uncharacterized protein n=1 Tax=Serratia marcescens TaxID=615 RepID=A0A939SR26_SERMA|nr:hypothetical protein [Serratia marcescens]